MIRYAEQTIWFAIHLSAHYNLKEYGGMYKSLLSRVSILLMAIMLILPTAVGAAA
ncbi:hypothetical protein [Paenibacillus sp. Z6-24]